jgi:excisionase family DNA binding protein
MAAAEEQMLTTGQLAKRLNVSTNTVGVWVKKGQLRPTLVTPGNRFRWLWSDVQRQMEEWRKREARRQQDT